MAMVSIRLPKSAEYDPASAVGLVNSLHSSYSDDAIFYWVVGWKGGTWWIVEVSNDGFSAESASTIVHSFYPMAELSDGFDILPEQTPVHAVRAFFEVDMNQWYYFPTRTAYDLKGTNDPLSALSMALDDVRDDEVFGYNLSLTGSSNHTAEMIDELMMQTRRERGDYIHPNRVDGFVDGFFEGRRIGKELNKLVSRYTQTDERIFRAKLSQPLQIMVVSVYAYGSDLERLKQKVQAIGTPVYQFCLPSIHRFSKIAVESLMCKTEDEVFQALPPMTVHRLLNEPVPEPPKKKNEQPKMRRIEYLQVSLTSAELAAFWHLPHKDLEGSRIHWLKSAQIPLPQAMKSMTPDEGVLMGVNRIGGKELPTYLPHDGRDRHAAIIGKSGTGKSSLMLRLINEDIAMGRGLCVLDPHGSLVKDIIRYSIPPEREGDVVILDVANHLDGVRYPPPLNPLARSVGGDATYTVVVNMVMNVFEKAYPGFSETQMGYILKNCLYTLEHENTPNLFDAQRLFRDPHYRARMVDKLVNLSTRDFWRTFTKQSANNLEKAWFPLQRRLSGFFDSNEALAITCHPKPLSMRDLMRDNKIVLVSLGSSGFIGESERRLLGAAVVSQVQMAAMTGIIPEGRLFMLYIDEAQNFVSSALPQILSEARKFHLSLHLANQYFKQLTGDTLDAIEGNIGTMFAFEVGESDAGDLKIFMGEKFTTDDLAKMGNYRAAVTTRYRNERQPPFSLETLPPPGHGVGNVTACETEYRIREKSIRSYTPMTEAEVIGAILKRLDELPVSEDDDGDFYEQPPTDQPKEE